MKKLFILTILGSLALSSCSDLDLDGAQAQQIKENAEELFGIIDPNQDWSNVSSGTVSVTADASLKNIAKVQILTESPFFNVQAKVLAEAEATKGQTLTLNYDAPRANTRLIAACVDNKGNYYIKGFNIGEEKVSFKSSSATRTRAAGVTRASSETPDLSAVRLDFNESFMSYNALRTLANYNSWKGKNWENDRLWWHTGSGSSNGWTISNSTIYRSATELSDDEKTNLQDIYNVSLFRDDPNDPNEGKTNRNNLALLREGNAVKFFSNHLVSNGKAPLTLCPIQMASTEAYWCDIYYYYFKADDIPAGTSEADYIKTLPKFKAIDLRDERLAFKAKTKISESKRDENFLRLHEYLLPYFGDASEFTPQVSTLSSFGYTTNGKFYRISNYSGNAKASIPASDHYITYDEDHNKNLKDENTRNIGSQLWQIFTNANDGTMMLYNVGSKKFLWWNDGDYVEFKDIAESSLKNFTVYLTNGSWKPYALEDITKQKVYILSAYKNNCIKALIDKGRALLFKGGKNISGDYQIAREWTFEEYNYPSATAISDLELSLDYFPASRIAPPSASASAIIPNGYRVGFMIRKDNGNKTENVNNNQRGELYGCGELNTEINTFGQFKSAVDLYGMELNDPRMATFTVNGKTYLCFEEGADTQYSDVILEIGGVTTTQVKKAIAEESDVATQDDIIDDEDGEGESGVYMFDDINEEDYTNMPFTMCFEDRPYEADYDMNDVVLRCIRIAKNKLQLSLIATGASDKVEIHGVPGEYSGGGTDLNGKEVHELFGMGDAEGEDRFINTKANEKYKITGIAGTYTVPETMTIPQFLSQIYIVNMSKGGEIHVPKAGQAPFALIIPDDFDYPNEGVSMKNAYEKFRNWANNASQYNEWLYWPEKEKIHENPTK